MTQTRAIVDKLLTNVSNGLFQGNENYISERILPVVPSKQRSGLYGSYGNEHLRIINTAHVGKGGYLEIDPITRSSDSYFIEEHALKTVITEEDFDNVEQPYDERADRTIGLTSLLWLAKEKALADTLMDPAIITQGVTLTSNSQYSELYHADSDPLGDGLVAKNTVRDACGMKPNLIAMSDSVADTLRVHEKLLDKLGFKWNRPGGLSDIELAQALDVKEILVGAAFYNNAKKGQTDNITKVWAKDMIYIVTAKKAAKHQKILGVEMRRKKSKPRQVFRFAQDEPINSEKLIVRDHYDQLLLNTECAYLIQDAIA